jgi:hypothetical protein
MGGLRLLLADVAALDVAAWRDRLPRGPGPLRGLAEQRRELGRDRAEHAFDVDAAALRKAGDPHDRHRTIL